MQQPPDVAVVIVAAGRGARAGDGAPKQFRTVGGKPILARTLERFLVQPDVRRVTVVIDPEHGPLYTAIVPAHAKLAPPVGGGPTRQQSVRMGLASLTGDAPRHVLIHDAARPFVSAGLIERVIGGLASSDAVLPALPITATLKSVADGRVAGTIAREGLQAAETPQGFRFAAILDAHERVAAAGLAFTDDAAIAEWAGMTVTVVAGEPGNIKLTTAGDIADADRRLTAEAALLLGDVRVGNGYDVHAFGPGDHVMLGGVAIRHDRGLVGHSDADVALHALTDAILGALAEGDIGVHFPPSDMRWRGASSDRFLAEAVARVKARGGTIAHLDLAIVAEEPKIGPHRDKMRAAIAAIAGVSIDRVAVKATTNEGIGFIGRGEGIAAIATATLRLPWTATI